jgi:rSAM/selenodomain-associated transferase 1
MLKEPRPGRVKTRLARGLGRVGAAWWYRHQAGALIRRLRDPRWQIVLAVAPDLQGLQSRVWPGDLPRIPQGGGDIGARMVRALGHATGPVCLIGSDIPGVTRAHIARAFAALRGDDAVFGPAVDGGFWLVGLRTPHRMPRGFMQGVRWSTRHALADTVATAGDLRVGVADTLCDVDTIDDLARPKPR